MASWKTSKAPSIKVFDVRSVANDLRFPLDGQIVDHQLSEEQASEVVVIEYASYTVKKHRPILL